MLQPLQCFQTWTSLSAEAKTWGKSFDPLTDWLFGVDTVILEMVTDSNQLIFDRCMLSKVDTRSHGLRSVFTDTVDVVEIRPFRTRHLSFAQTWKVEAVGPMPASGLSVDCYRRSH